MDDVRIFAGPRQKRAIDAPEPYLPRVIGGADCVFLYAGDMSDGDLDRLGSIAEQICAAEKLEIGIGTPGDVFRYFIGILEEATRRIGLRFDPALAVVLKKEEI